MVNTKAIAGFVAGLSIGAIAAVLLSPEKGSAIRQRIIDKATGWCNAAKDSITDLVKNKKTESTRADESGNPFPNVNTMG